MFFSVKNSEVVPELPPNAVKLFKGYVDYRFGIPLSEEVEVYKRGKELFTRSSHSVIKYEIAEFLNLYLVYSLLYITYEHNNGESGKYKISVEHIECGQQFC
ncbi:hypothetical protein [Saccharolobus islandicus]|uniref:Uncharacterized protein n=1 Tax=Saccharolobus islandicus LAL14/1 TaxID=1241935 RepID=M9U4Z2_SACIS|nr:hypothetical protein [Sulfolobus islandicus]AGJ62079.1 Hypothetical Protein SiL_0614 [Sulfolobus islandicus LAL14/1]WCM36552.1 hypothetical protein GO599_02915 [Sulfolobus islandicus]